MRKTISQAEARRLKKSVRELVTDRSNLIQRYGNSYPGTVLCGTGALPLDHMASISTAQKLGFAVFAKIDGERLYFYAVKP